MIRYLRVFVVLGGLGLATVRAAGPDLSPVIQRTWFETRSAHFNIYSCAAATDVYALATHLEQFCEAYTRLAGAKAMASPPIVVLAFPDYDAMKPFLPLYQGKPGNLAGFFKRGSDENLIVLALPGTNSAFTQMGVILHEYAHLLFRYNARTWPLWLNEGMAEIYSTFETTGYTVRIGKPIEPYLDLLERRPLMSLTDLFAVTQDSPEYNERERQGIFYAQSWLLAHYLTSGGALAYKARFGQFTRLLHEGQRPEQAFTNALQTSLPAIEGELRRYRERGIFPPLQWAFPVNLNLAKAMSTRILTPTEVCFRLGDELLRIDRLDAAETYFDQAQKLAPGSALASEGLGLLAAAREKHADAARYLKEALRRGSTSFLAHYIYAREKYSLTADAKERYMMLTDEKAAGEIRDELRKAIAVMPNFGPAHQLLGFFETVQADDLSLAKQHLMRAIELEPDNPSYVFSLAQAQLRNHEPDAARQTLAPLLRPQVEEPIRRSAEELLKKIKRTEQ